MTDGFCRGVSRENVRGRTGLRLVFQERARDEPSRRVAPAQSDEVDQLYRQIQQMRAREAAEAEKILEGH